MQHVPHFWSDLKTTDFARLDLARTIAILPLGATEQHGPHLPLSVDTDLVNGVVQAALPHVGELPVLVLPTQPIGFSPEHFAFAGTLGLKASTVIAVWTEIAERVAASGIKKLVLLNAHGGQAALMDVVGRDLRQRLKLLVYSVNWYDLPDSPATAPLFDAHERRFGVHGGDMETSMMLALAPNLVDMNRAENFDSQSARRAPHFPLLGNGKSAKLSWAMQDYNPKGAAGHAANASADKGRALLDNAGKQLAALLHEIDRLPTTVLHAGGEPQQ
jgi:creatinine amidohydrolase